MWTQPGDERSAAWLAGPIRTHFIRRVSASATPSRIYWLLIEPRPCGSPVRHYTLPTTRDDFLLSLFSRPPSGPGRLSQSDNAAIAAPPIVRRRNSRNSRETPLAFKTFSVIISITSCFVSFAQANSKQFDTSPSCCIQQTTTRSCSLGRQMTVGRS